MGDWRQTGLANFSKGIRRPRNAPDLRGAADKALHQETIRRPDATLQEVNQLAGKSVPILVKLALSLAVKGRYRFFGKINQLSLTDAPTGNIHQQVFYAFFEMCRKESDHFLIFQDDSKRPFAGSKPENPPNAR